MHALARVCLGSNDIYSVEAEVEHPEPGASIFKALLDDVLEYPNIQRSEKVAQLGNRQKRLVWDTLDMLEHEVGRICDEYAWCKLTRKCWNTHVLAAAAIGTKGEMWSLNQPRNGTRSLVSCLRE
ncbi:hypothetical protein Tco_0667287 [Tanacetum coccineum]